VSIAIAHQLGISAEKIRAAVENFKGVKRRFEYVLKNNRIVFVDDYAHHPEELKALISGARELFPGRKCIIIFQPHLFSRTKDLAAEFARSLDLADEVILLPIYPARELPIEGVSSALIMEKMKLSAVSLVGKDQLISHLEGLDDRLGGNLLITAGAGDIDTLVQPIKELIERI
jgi:UDP-N-acetylmuramate--alanine ligase